MTSKYAKNIYILHGNSMSKIQFNPILINSFQSVRIRHESHLCLQVDTGYLCVKKKLKKTQTGHAQNINYVSL